MAITGAISRSRKNDFVQLEKEENKIKDLIENAAEGDNITLHAGDYRETKLTVTTPIEIPEGVYVTILPGAVVETDRSKDPNGSSDEFPEYPIFTGKTKNISDLNEIGHDSFLDRAVWSIEHAKNIDLQSVSFDDLTVDDSGSHPALSVNKDGNSKTRVGSLNKNQVVYVSSDEGELSTSSDFTFNGQKFVVNTKQEIGGTLSVSSQASVDSLNVEDLSDNSIVVSDTKNFRSGELVEYDYFQFDGSEFQVGSKPDNVDSKFYGSLLFNKDNSPYDVHLDPSDGVLIEDGVLSINDTSLDTDKTLKVVQGSKSNGIYVFTKSSKNSVLTINDGDSTAIVGQGEDVFNINGKGDVILNKLEIGDIVSTETGQDLIFEPDTNTTTFRSSVIINSSFTAIGETEFHDNFLTINAGGSGAPSRNAGIFVNRPTSFDVDIRWNESAKDWEATADGSNYTSIINTTGTNVITNIVDQTIPSGGSHTFDVSSIFSGGTTTDDTGVKVYVEDNIGSSPTNGEYINAVGVMTLVRKASEYVVYNEHSSSLDFRLVLRKF